ncbi:unnamed protein product [Caenorhabditis sp. 36 PRJEB53466]|nr:unnamed protein product [Caenorhabditis sp. 36 PRJEB53466]
MFLCILIICIVFVGADHITFSPPEEAFVLYHSHQNTNFTSVFVQDGCPNSRNLLATVYSSDVSTSRRVFEEVPLHCAVKVRIITEKVTVVRPYVDLLAVVDESLISHVGSICVHAQLTSFTSATELGKCYLNSHDQRDTSSCVIRVPVPFSWFPEHNRTSVVSVSYTISEKCDQNFHDLPQHLVEINSKMAKQKIDWLANATDVSVTLRSSASQSFSQNSMQTMFLHVNSWGNETQPMEIRLWVDSRMSIETVYPTSPNWTIRVSSASRPFFYTSLTCKPQEGMTGFNDNIVAILIKMVSSTEVMKDDVVLHWHVIFGSPAGNNAPDDHKVATKFSVISDEIAAVIIVPRRNELMNMAVISGQQVTSSLRVFTVSIGAKPEDVTSLSHCISSDANILKVSPTCSSVYLDGSETNGSSDAQIYAHFLRYTTAFSFRVWYPKLPLKIWTSSSQLSAIKDWKVGFWRDLPSLGGVKRSRAARQFACVNRFQNANIKVLASLWIEDIKTGDQLYLSSHKSILFDVTNIVHNTLQISNRSVANVQFHEGRAVMYGENPGVAKLIVRNTKRSQDLVSENVMVRSEEVTTTGLSARPICETSFRILPILFSAAFFKIEINHSKSLTKLYQQCSISASVSYSDGTWEPLNDVDSTFLGMTAHSDNERVLAVSHHASKVHVIAIDDGFPMPSVEISLHSSAQCASTTSGAAPAFLAVTVLNVPIRISGMNASEFSMESDTSTPSGDRENQSLPSVPMHVFVLTILGMILLFLLISCSGYSGNKSTAERQSSNGDDPSRTSISYHGSEISVFIAPSQANVVVNQSRHPRYTLVDSNSDHNLARVVPKEEKWTHDQFHTWTWKQRGRTEPPIRESIA